MSIRKKAGIDPKGDWYVVTNDFMMATLKKADKDKGCFMTDSSTYVVGKKDLSNIVVLFKGDPYLINTYHALAAPKGSTPGAELGYKMVDFPASDAGQKIIGTFGKDTYGEPLYNDAEYAKQYDC